MPRDHYSEVGAGTKKRQILDLMLRPQGCTRNEISEVTGDYPQSICSTKNALMDCHGYDVRAFKNLNQQARWGRVIYKIVGRWTWDGEYETYIDPNDYAGEIFGAQGGVSHDAKP